MLGAEPTRSEYTVQQTAAYHRDRLTQLQDRITSPDYRRSVRDLVLLDSARAFLDRVASDDLGIFATEPGDPCTRQYPEVGHEDEGYSCSTHNMPWGECDHQSGDQESGVDHG